MQWVIDNWIWILFGVAMIGMHMFGHGHGGHGQQGHAGADDETAGHGGHSCCGGKGKQDHCCGGASKKKRVPGSDGLPVTDPESPAGSVTLEASPVVRRRGS